MTKPETFVANLSATIEWCLHRVDASDPKWCLRSEELRPNEEFDPIHDPSLWNSPGTVESVVNKRRSLVPKPLKNSNKLRGGRLLLCFFDYTNHNEMTAVETNWYFDWFDNPPWDTWISLVGDALVSWVPAEFVSSVNHAISVECIGMLVWADSPRSNYPVAPDEYGSYPDWLIELAASNITGD